MVGTGYESLLTADYSQIELRIMAHLSGDEALIAAFESGHDFHATTASRVFGVEPDGRDTGEQRAEDQGDELRAGLRAVRRSGCRSSCASPSTRRGG